MAKLRHYYNGISVYKPAGSHTRGTHKRSKTKGWTSDATNRNKKFLQSIDTQNLTGFGIAITLTLKDCPQTPKDWHQCRDLFVRRLKRKGMIRFHWVTEWQKRGVPHLHMSGYFEKPLTKRQIRAIKADWCEIASKYRPLQKSQYITPITSLSGWLEYSAKHGARGMHHYQRSNPPKEWQENTGRVWGKGGDWPQVEIDTVIYTNQFYKFRRLVKKWRIADARKTKVKTLVDAEGKTFPDAYQQQFKKELTKTKRKRISSARKLLKKNTRKHAEVVGLSEWIGLELQSKMLQFVMSATGDIPSQNQEEPKP